MESEVTDIEMDWRWSRPNRLEDAMNVALVLTGLFLVRLLIPVIMIVFIGTMINKRQVQAF